MADVGRNRLNPTIGKGPRQAESLSQIIQPRRFGDRNGSWFFDSPTEEETRSVQQANSTALCAGRKGGAPSASLHRQRWISSSRRTPCPLCGRDCDDKCRRNDSLISCYWGERFSPPAGLRVGEVVTIEGGRWAVLSLAGGFAGNSAILRPHVDRLDFKPAARRRQKREAAAMAPALRDLFGKARRFVHACLAISELEHATASELRRDQELVNTTIAVLQEMREPLVLARREDPAMGPLVAAVDHWLRLLSYQADDLANFSRWALGVPSAHAVAALREVQ